MKSETKFYIFVLVSCITHLVQSQSIGGVCLEETNKNRWFNGLAPLTNHPSLIKAAIKHNNHMIKTECYAHKCPGEEQSIVIRATNEGYPNAMVGENLDVWRKDCKEALKSWMNSKGHRENIVGNYIHIGCAFGKSKSKYRRFYTCMYGNPV